jgi:hypothetical protein
MTPPRKLKLGFSLGVIAVGLLWAAQWVSSPAVKAAGSDITTAGYRFSNVSVGPQPDPQTREALPDHARVTYDVSWADAGRFPGKHRCTWRLFDDSGAQVGETTIDLMALQSSYSKPIHTDVNTSGVAGRAEVECDSARLDTANGTIEISNVHIWVPETEKEKMAWGARTIRVLFDYAWRGQGDPTPQACTTRVLDSSGNVVLTSHGAMALGGRENSFGFNALALPAPDDLETLRPTSATMSCRPMG